MLIKRSYRKKRKLISIEAELFEELNFLKNKLSTVVFSSCENNAILGMMEEKFS